MGGEVSAFPSLHGGLPKRVPDQNDRVRPLAVLTWADTPYWTGATLRPTTRLLHALSYLVLTITHDTGHLLASLPPGPAHGNTRFYR